MAKTLPRCHSCRNLDFPSETQVTCKVVGCFTIAENNFQENCAAYLEDWSYILRRRAENENL